MELKLEVVTFLFLTLGPIKIVGPFANITRNATPALANQIALRATLFSSIAILLAALVGERILSSYHIPLPILTLSGGILLFVVALLGIIKQFDPPVEQHDSGIPPTLNKAMNPLAFPTIVTPYGIAAVIVFLSLSPDLNGKLKIGAILLGIMALNLVVMLVTRYMLKPLTLVLAILGAVLGIIQVALGLLIIYNSIKELQKI